MIAIPSGIGVSLAVLNSAMTAGVGVAISASLLPPAVNLGMLLAYYALGTMNEGFDRENLWQMAICSITLTLENIFIVVVMAITVFYFKHAWRNSSSDKGFWKLAGEAPQLDEQGNPVQTKHGWTPGTRKSEKTAHASEGHHTTVPSNSAGDAGRRDHEYLQKAKGFHGHFDKLDEDKRRERKSSFMGCAPAMGNKKMQ